MREKNGSTSQAHVYVVVPHGRWDSPWVVLQGIHLSQKLKTPTHNGMFLFASPFILSLIEELKKPGHLHFFLKKWSTLRDTVNFYDFKVFIFKSLIATIVFEQGDPSRLSLYFVERITRGMLRRDLRMFLFNSTRTLRGEGIIYTKVKRRERKTSWGKEAEEVKISLSSLEG